MITYEYPIVYDRGDIYWEEKLAILDKTTDINIEEKLSDGKKTLRFKMSLRDVKSRYIVDDARILFGGNAYIVRNVAKDRTVADELVLSVECYGNEIELRDHMNEVLDIDTETAEQALTKVLEDNPLGWQVGTVDIDTKYRSYKADFTNALLNLVTMHTLWGGYLEFDTKNRLVHWKKSRGRNEGFRIQYGKNIESIKRTEDYRDMVTKLYPFGYNGLSVFDYNGYDKFYLENYSYYTEQGYSLEEARKKFTKIAYMKDDNYVEQKALWDDFSKKLEKQCRPQIGYQIKFLDRSCFEEFAHEGQPQLGDMVKVIDPELGVSEQQIAKIKIYPHEIWRTVINLGNFMDTYDAIVSDTSAGRKSYNNLKRKSSFWNTAVEDTKKNKSEIIQNEQEIILRVRKDNVISSINQTAESIRIRAHKVDLDGYATFRSLEEEGETVINGKNITTGEINAVDVRGVNIYGSKFYDVNGDAYLELLPNDEETDMNLFNKKGERVFRFFSSGTGFSALSSYGNEIIITADSNIIMRNDWGYKGSEVLSKLTEGNGISLNRSGSNENTGSSYAISIDKDEISKGLVKDNQSQGIKLQVYNGELEFWHDGIWKKLMSQ